jgi:hypothetical protein
MPIWDVDLVKYIFLCNLHVKIGFKVEVDTFQGFALEKTKWSQLLDSNGRKLGNSWIFKNQLYLYILGWDIV